MNQVDTATQALHAAITKHKDRVSNKVDALVVKTMTTLTASIAIADANAEIVQMRLEKFADAGDIIYVEFCKVMLEKARRKSVYFLARWYRQ
jgi:hypothetical protein